jgi:hypothetical protein
VTRQPHEDEEADDDFDPEGPDPSEMDASEEPDLEVCPHCRKLISEEAERCPHCGQYINVSDEPASIVTWVVIIALALASMGIFGFLWFN